MGCDGGTIPRRCELVKTRKKLETKDQASHLNFQWKYCNITQQFLRRPVVTCGLGRFYNKSSILEAIVNKRAPKHIKTLKDVLELNLTSTDAYFCPVTGLEMSGRFKFVALWSCGCVFSERAVKEVKMEACPRCTKRFDEEDVVILNSENEEELKMMRERMEKRKKRRKMGRVGKI